MSHVVTLADGRTFYLGRNQSLPDQRNWTADVDASGELQLYVPKKVADPALDAALAAFLKKHYSVEAKNLATIVAQRIESLLPTPTPTPTPVPPTPTPTPSVWALGSPGVVDQGNTPHCVGGTGLDFLNLDEVEDHLPASVMHTLYYECKVIDGEPKAEDGSSIHSLARALKNRGRINAYAWLTSTAAIRKFVQTQGPVPIGIDWFNDMSTPDSGGIIHPTGGVAGGHAITIVGDYIDKDLALVLNHWGLGWGNVPNYPGYFLMPWAELGPLCYTNGGEALATIELPLAA